ncbi:endothelin-converting enzyme 2-like protein [Neofusicoccum parvum]|nr:endothelin-converting enzyme 2-like protein [Neofusicoccum parvum]
MAPEPPPFAQSTYWDERFTKNPSAFDWLQPANCLDGPILDALQHATSHGNPRPRLLHIGCGTSVLSLHIRSHVPDPRQVHNTDFSRVAIQLGARWEREVFEPERTAQEASESSEGKGKAPNPDSAPPPPPPQQEPSGTDANARLDIRNDGADHPPRMRWTTLDLLSLPEIRALGGPYAVVVDKSTCDAISCGDDVVVPLPHPLQLAAAASGSSSPSSSLPATPVPASAVRVHPLHILALHLASVVSAGGRWIALSYSGHRFPFFEPFPARVEEGRLDAEVLARGFVHPGRLWRLERREMVEVEEEGGAGGGAGTVVHRPKTAHWVYVMVRTEVEVNVKA